MTSSRIGYWVIVVLVLAASALPAQAEQRLVPSQYATIQAGIDAAQTGDEVVIADGVYTGVGNRDLDFHGKAITVRSASGDPAACIIDCEVAGRGFDFHTGETPASVVQGLTIRNGGIGDGGGVLCDYSSPTLTNCTITGNSAEFGLDGGGGVYCWHSNPTLTNCTITGNSAAYYAVNGGGVYCDSSSPTLTNCVIAGNTADYGSGMYCIGGSPTLTNCTIAGNLTEGGGVYCGYDCRMTLTNCMITGNSGSGVSCSGSWPTLTNCTITSNSANFGGVGGGVNAHMSYPVLRDCSITNNSADLGGGVYYGDGDSLWLVNCTVAGNSGIAGGGIFCDRGVNVWLGLCTISGNTAAYGGGVYCDDSFAVLTSCLITENSSYAHGGGVNCYRSSTYLVNCTIAGNLAAEGGGVFCWLRGYASLLNCILWGDEPYEIAVDASSLSEVGYCDVQGGSQGDGNVDADPLFRDPDGPDNDPNTWADNDYRLRPGSPCIDAGDNDAVPPGVLTDLAGNPRFFDDPPTPDTGHGTPPIVDMGAYEFDVAFATCPGDCDCDWHVGFSDIDYFVAAIPNNQPAWTALYGDRHDAALPPCSFANCDVNGNGNVGFDDIDPFVRLIPSACH